MSNGGTSQSVQLPNLILDAYGVASHTQLGMLVRSKLDPDLLPSTWWEMGLSDRTREAKKWTVPNGLCHQPRLPLTKPTQHNLLPPEPGPELEQRGRGK